jgi:hypothetical protein
VGGYTYYHCATLHDLYKTRRKRKPEEAEPTLPAVGITATRGSLGSELPDRHKAYLRINRYLQQFKPSAHPDAKEAIPLLKDFAGIWRQMNLTERRAILQTIFTGLYFDAEGQLRKASANSPFDRLLGLVLQEPGIPVDLKEEARIA